MEKDIIMKRIFTGLFAVVATIVGLSGCDAEKTTYSGPEYVMFSDTLSYFPVQNSDDWFKVHVASTVACDYDRTYGVEVDDKNSNAVENKHYVIESNTVTIKAGERAVDLKIRGLYDNIGKTDSLSVTFRLIADDDKEWAEYGTKTRVEMQKACPFDLHTFTGYCKLTSTYYSDYMRDTDMRLLKVKPVEGEENTVVLPDFFYKGYDIKLKFDSSDPLKPFVEMDNQILGSTAEAFGTIYGDGKLLVKQPTVYTSYYNVCQSYVFLYITVYVENVDTVGTYVNMIEWISDEEAEQLKKQGY